MNPQLIAQLVVNGILTGGILALAAMGLTIIFGVMDVVNFAHGTYVMLAMYAGYLLWEYFGMNPFVAVLFVGPLFFLFGIVSERLVINPIVDRSMYAQVFATVGLLWIFKNTALVIFGATAQTVNVHYGGFLLAGVAIQTVRLIGFAVAIVVTALLYLFLYRTKTGLAIRATAQSRELAEPFGVNIDRIYMITFGIGIALAGIAGSVIIATQSVTPTTGTYYVLIAFVIVTLGGLGSVSGAFLGGLFIGIVDAFISYYLSPALAPPIYLTLFIAVLVMRATGPLGQIRFRVKQLLPKRVGGA
jgi:branched-chain amino acid transport system permease protein